MKPKTSVILNEWTFTISITSRGRLRVAIESVDQRDRPFAAALARLTEVWLRQHGVRP